jgi:hydroxyacylglutathione hydrolase
MPAPRGGQPALYTPSALSRMTLHPLPAFDDNYIWLLHEGARALVVDPGEPEVVLNWLVQHNVALDTILITHHHADHTGGVAALREATGARVIGPAFESMPEPLDRVGRGESVTALGLRFEVIDVPGHTAGHIAFFAPDAPGGPLLFCGDTLFSAGCGRLFEGTAAQMHESLTRLAALPGDTRVCCAHEYTLSNIKFAQAVEPDNAALADYAARCMALRAGNLPTLPSSIALERQINPFLRTDEASVAQAARKQNPALADDPVAVLATLREWKNGFR